MGGFGVWWFGGLAIESSGGGVWVGGLGGFFFAPKLPMFFFWKIIDLVQFDNIHSMQQRSVLFQTFNQRNTVSRNHIIFVKKNMVLPLQWLSWPNALSFRKSLAGAMLFGELPASQEVLRTKRLASLGYANCLKAFKTDIKQVDR